MKKAFLILVINLVLFNNGTYAQSWIPQAAHCLGTGLQGSAVLIGDISVVNDSVAWAITTSFTGGAREFARTTNRGITWKNGVITSPGPTLGSPTGHSTYKICAIDSLTAWVATFDKYNYNDGRIYKTINGGLTWVHQTTAYFANACKFVHFFSANEGVAVGENEVYTTTNGGTTWISQSNLPVPQSIVGPTEFNINAYEVLRNNIWLGDISGIVYYSSNKGATWSVKSGVNGAMAYQSIKGITFKDSLNGMATCSYYVPSGPQLGGHNTDDAKFFKTSDGGTTWTGVSYNSASINLTNEYMAKYDICYIPNSGNSYILSSEYLGQNLFSSITTDGGNTWTYIDSTVAHTALAFLPSGNGWSGGYITGPGNGIYKWSSSSTNPVGIVDYQKKLNNEVKILYEGSSIYLSNDLVNEKPNALRILNAEGKKVRILNCKQEAVQKLDTENLSHGIYLLEIEIGKSVLHKKIIIQ